MRNKWVVMPNQSNHKDLVYYSTSNSVFSALTVIMFKCVSNSETLAYSTLSACGQSWFPNSLSRGEEGKITFSLSFQHTPFIVQCLSFGLHRVAPETQHQCRIVSNLNLKRLQLPAAEVMRLSVSSSPPTSQIWGDRLHFPSCWWFLRPRSKCSATASDFSYLLLTCRSDSRIHHRRLLSTVK